MSLSVSPVSGAHAPHQAARFSGAPSFGHDPNEGGDQVAFSGVKPAKGSSANFGVITGLLACCAIVPFAVGMLAMGGIALATRKAIKGVSHIHLPHAQ